MNQETEEWVEKAEGDWGTMIRESLVTEGANLDAVCFHAQQCAEKYFKALLVENGVGFQKTHDLVKLLNDLLLLYPEMDVHSEGAVALTAFGVEFRCPGENADNSDVTDSIKYCTQIRFDIRKALRLDD